MIKNEIQERPRNWARVYFWAKKSVNKNKVAMGLILRVVLIWGDYNTLSFISDQKLKQQETPDLNEAQIDSE